MQCHIQMSYTLIENKMELTKEQKLRPAIEALGVSEFWDLPKDNFTASAARQAVNRIQKEDFLNVLGANPEDRAELIERKFQVSETAYPGGTRVTRLA